MPEWLEYLLRILMAVGLCFVIGIERQLRLKVAGIRTHALVAAGACLFMIISKYGFGDSTQFDASRIASQVVSGISFIGAGMILHRQQVVHGLTSAAGIWLTAAIGMAAGAGLYYVALGAAAIMVMVQLVFHIPLPIFMEKHYNELKLIFKSPNEDCTRAIKQLFDIKNFTALKAERQGEEIVYSAVVNTKKQIDSEFIRNAVNEYPYIISIEKLENDR